MSFRPNRKFKKEYNRLFKTNPEAANLFLLLCELADENGQVETSEEELAVLMGTRFNNPRGHAFGGVR